MQTWIPNINSFRCAIWHKLVSGAMIEEDGRTGDSRRVTLDILFDTFLR